MGQLWRRLITACALHTVVFPLTGGAAESAISPDTSAKGTKGWMYTDRGGGVAYATDPVSACKGWTVPWVTQQFVGIELDTGILTDGDFYWYHYANQLGPYTIGTVLVCDTGYVARWPGVCVPTKVPASPKPACSAGQPGFAVGDPVTVIGGVKIEREIDLAAVTNGTLEVSRVYRSIGHRFTLPVSAPNWTFSFERDIVVVKSRVYVYAGDGSMATFAQSGDRFLNTDHADQALTYLPAADQWWYRTSDNTLEQLGRIGDHYRLLAVYRASGASETLTYDDSGKIQSVEDNSGRRLVFTWEGNELHRIAGPQGTVQYEVEQLAPTANSAALAPSRIATVRKLDADGEILSTRAYHYVAALAQWTMLAGYTDDDGVRQANDTYDGNGRVIASEHALGADGYRFDYGATDTKVTDALGAQRTYSFTTVNGTYRVAAVSQPGGAGCLGAANHITYDAHGLVASYTDFNKHQTCFAHDAVRGLETQRLEGLDAGDACPADLKPRTASQRIVSTRWHPRWHLVTQSAAPLLVTSYIYNGETDANGATVTCSPGTLPDGAPLAVLCKKIEQPTSDPTGADGFAARAAGAARVTSYTYNEAGQMLTRTEYGRAGTSGDTTHFSYYTASSADYRTGDLATVTNPKGHVRAYLAFTPAGLPTAIKEVNGQLTRLAYNGRGQVTEFTESADSQEERTTRAQYDSNGNVALVTFPDRATLQFIHDSARRLTGIVDGSGNSLRYTLDAAGHTTREESADPDGRLARLLTRTHDALGRMDSISGGGAQ